LDKDRLRSFVVDLLESFKLTNRREDVSEVERLGFWPLPISEPTIESIFSEALRCLRPAREEERDLRDNESSLPTALSRLVEVESFKLTNRREDVSEVERLSFWRLSSSESTIESVLTEALRCLGPAREEERGFLRVDNAFLPIALSRSVEVESFKLTNRRVDMDEEERLGFWPLSISESTIESVLSEALRCLGPDREEERGFLRGGNASFLMQCREIDIGSIVPFLDRRFFLSESSCLPPWWIERGGAFTHRFFDEVRFGGVRGIFSSQMARVRAFSINDFRLNDDTSLLSDANSRPS